MKTAPGTYHHGNLRTALLETAYQAVAHGGPAALVIRDLARTIGVSPSAAYHHFPDRDHLYAVVSQQAREALASRMLTAMASAGATLPPGTTSTARTTSTAGATSVAQLAAACQAYLDFAHDEPQLLRIAFSECKVMVDRPDDPAAWDVLVEALDSVADAGAMDPTRRPGAEVITWSALHGASVLRNDGAFSPEIPRTHTDPIVIAGILTALGCPSMPPPVTSTPPPAPKASHKHPS